MIKTVCAKFREHNHPNNTLLLTWAAFLSHFRPILHDLYGIYGNPEQCQCGQFQSSRHKEKKPNDYILIYKYYVLTTK